MAFIFLYENQTCKNFVGIIRHDPTKPFSRHGDTLKFKSEINPKVQTLKYLRQKEVKPTNHFPFKINCNYKLFRIEYRIKYNHWLI